MCIMGAYAMATTNTRGSHRTVDEYVHRGPSTVITMANYLTRARTSGVGTVGKMSIIYKGGRGNELLSLIRRTVGGGTRIISYNSVVGTSFRRVTLTARRDQVHTGIGVRSKYDGCYTCYVVPCTEKEIHSQDVRGVRRRIHLLTGGNCKRVILANVRVNSCNESVSGGIALVSMVREIYTIRNMGQIHLNSLRPIMVAPSFMGQTGTLGGLYPRFRVSLRDNYGRALGEVGHRCATRRCCGTIALLERDLRSATVAASLVINFPKRARRRFGGSCSFYGGANFTRVRVFGCSMEQNAETRGLPGRIDGTMGSREDKGVLTLTHRVRGSFCRDYGNGQAIILTRRGGNSDCRYAATGCVSVCIGSSGSVAKRFISMVLGNSNAKRLY